MSLKLADRSREKAKIRLKSCRGEELDRERKRRTNRMLIAMVTIFGISWLPLNLVNLLNDLSVSMAWWKYYNLCFFLAHTVAMSSTCYNVFLYVRHRLCPFLKFSLANENGRRVSCCVFLVECARRIRVTGFNSNLSLMIHPFRVVA